jgi:hypothetical protein
MFKYNKFKIEITLEKKASHYRNHGANKKEHIKHSYVISFSSAFDVFQPSLKCD